MELSREILKQFAQIANGNSNKKQTTPSYMNATAVVSDGVKYVKIDGSDQMTPVSETMGIQNGDRVLVTIENHQATVIGNYSYPADARTANEALSVGGQALTAAGQAAQRIDVLQASSITTEKLEAGLATIGYLTVTELRALIATVDTLDAKAITTDKLETESLKAGFAKIDQIEAAYATIEQLNSTNAKIETLEAGRVTAEEIKAAVAEVGYLLADEAELKYATIEQLNAKTVTAEEILGVVIEAGYLTANNADLKYATITSLNAATARIGTLETDTLKTKDLESEVGKFGYLKASEAALQYATIGALNAEAANISNLNAEFATFKSTTTQDLIAAKGWMAEGSIGDAQISKVSANKLDAGTIDTSVVTVKSSDGKLQIADNTLQISDANRVRVQVGKDGTGDYTLAVWDVNGQLIWDALGATENTIQRAIIRDSMVSGDAAIQALKIDFQSFETALTQQGLTISGTVVQVGDKQLNVVLSEQSQYIDDIVGGINLLLNTSFNEGLTYWEPGGSSGANYEITTLDNKTVLKVDLSKLSTTGAYYDFDPIVQKIYGLDISADYVFSAKVYVEEAITCYVSWMYEKVDDIGWYSAGTKEFQLNTGWNDIVYSGWYSAPFSVKNYIIAIGCYRPKIIYVYHPKVEKGTEATYWKPAPEDGIEWTDNTTLSSHETRITANEEAINLRVTSQEFTEYQNGVAANFSSIDTSLSVLNGAIESKVTQTEIDNAIAGIDIGGRNLLRNSNFKNGSQYWLGVNAPLNVIADSVYGNALSFYTTIKGSVSDRIYYDTSSQGFSHVAGETYTLSFFAKASVNTELQSSVAGNATSIETYELTTTWQRFTHTYTAPQHGSLSFWPVDANVTIYLTNVKLEKGNKATDWTPAPEDVDANIASISTRVSELSIDLDGITQRVSATETTTTGLESRVSTAESKLTKDGLVTTIGSYYTTLGQLNNAIDSIDIGGRNLLTKTKTLDTTGVAEKLDETYLGFTVGHYDATSLGTSSYKDVLSGWIPTKEPEAGGQYVLSFYAKGSGQIRTHFYGGSYKTILSENSSNNTNTASDGFSIFNLTSEWKKYWVRYTLESSNTLSTTGNKTVLFRVYGGNEVYVCGVKLEKGNKPTDWSPAPEDAGTIDDIIIGGRNLILQSKDFTTGSKYWSIASPWTTSVDDEGYTVASINVIGNSSTAWYRLIPQNNIPTSECTNGVIVSFDFMCDDLAALDNKCICSLQNYASDGSRIAWYEPTFDTTHARYIPGVYSFSEELENGKWVRVTVKFTYADLTKTYTESIPDYSRLSFNLVQNGSIHIRRCKAEYGNKATDWTPAPEDIDASISHATSIATQTASKFNWLVTSASSESSLTLTDTMLTAITDQFKVVGPDGSTTIISGGTMNINNIFAQTINATGNITASDIHATGGTIGGFNITDSAIYSTTTVNGTLYQGTMWKAIDSPNNWFWGVHVGGVGQAYLTYGGYLYANDANIKGVIDATTITAKDEYKIYTGSYGNETIIHAYDWGGDGQRAVEFGLPNTTYPSVIYMFTSSSGSVLSFYASGNASFNCRVYFESAVDIYGATSIYSSLTTSGDITVNGTISGKMSASGFRSYNDAGMFFNQYGNIQHLRSDSADTWEVCTNAGVAAFKVQYENGNVFIGGSTTCYNNIACTGIMYVNTLSNNSGNLTKITGTSFILLQANGFALRVGEGVNGASYKVLMPVTTANAASNDVVYLGVPSARWKFIYSASSVNVSSDERDKNITELDERYLNAFHKLKVITYRWKNDPEKLHIGFSAQAVKRAMNTHGIDTTDMGAICHDFWTDEETGEEKERYSLCYEEITLLTVPVVQKHSVTLTEHAAKLVNIESQLESMKAELDEAHIRIKQLEKLVNVS